MLAISCICIEGLGMAFQRSGTCFIPRALALLAVTSLTAACTETRSSAGLGTEAAEPATARRVHYESVTAGFVAYRPVNPTDWRRSNERVAPSGSHAR